MAIIRIWIGLGAAFSSAFFGKLEWHILQTTPPVWWGWWDQSQYLKAAQAFLHGDWSADSHWYPAGYSLLAAPFVPLLPQDPFMVIDLACLIGSLIATVRLTEIMELPVAAGVAAFLIACVTDQVVLRHYVLPWTSTPSGCLILLAACFCLSPPTVRRSFILGCIAGLIFFIKPVDGIALAPLGIYYALQLMKPKDVAFSWQIFLRNILAGAMPLAAFICATASIHYIIYGPQLSAYEAKTTAGPVFLKYHVFTRFYALVVDPHIFYDARHPNQGLVSRFPWMVTGFCGMATAVLKRSPICVLGLSAILYLLLYSSYYELTPYDTWYYNCVHYFIWTLPVFGIFTFYVLKQIVVKRSLSASIVTAIILVLLFIIHPVLSPVRNAGAEAATNKALLDLSACNAPCVVDFDVGADLSDQQARESIAFPVDTMAAWGARTSFIYPYAKGIRIILLNTTGARAAISIKPPLIVKSATVYETKWRFLRVFMASTNSEQT